MSKLVMVDTLSSFRMRYVVRIEDDSVLERALDTVLDHEDDVHFKEFSQKHIDPNGVIDYREITEEEYLRIFDEDNDYLASWTDEQKKSYINVVIVNSEPMEYDDGA